MAQRFANSELALGRTLKAIAAGVPRGTARARGAGH